MSKTWKSNSNSIARFWSKVERVESGCWEWRGAVHAPPKLPYGKFCSNRKHFIAHRFSWLIVYGNPTKQILHRCDNPRCASPFHLFEGTQLDNIRDCVRKGRRCKQKGRQKSGFGIQQHSAKLDDEKVRKILLLYKPYSFGTPKLARLFGVSHPTIQRIVQRKTWRHVS